MKIRMWLRDGHGEYVAYHIDRVVIMAGDKDLNGAWVRVPEPGTLYINSEHVVAYEAKLDG